MTRFGDDSDADRSEEASPMDTVRSIVAAVDFTDSSRAAVEEA